MKFPQFAMPAAKPVRWTGVYRWGELCPFGLVETWVMQQSA